MAETLKRASVVLKVTSGKGSRIEVKWQSDMPGVPKPSSPDRVLERAADEIARIAELCGFGDKVEGSCEGRAPARARTPGWRREGTDMTDRELLELAARAAGTNWRDWTPEVFLGESELREWPYQWNPLTDDGDALRLAVKLRIDVIHNDPQDNDAWVLAGPDCDCVEDVNGEASRSAAVRRAIVRAAAEVGKAMP